MFYRRSSDNALMIVPISTSPVLSVGQARPLFHLAGLLYGVSAARYAVTKDGKRFLMNAGNVRVGEGGSAPRPGIQVKCSELGAESSNALCRNGLSKGGTADRRSRTGVDAQRAPERIRDWGRANAIGRNAKRDCSDRARPQRTATPSSGGRAISFQVKPSHDMRL